MRRSHSSYFKQTGGSFERSPMGEIRGISPTNSMFFGTMDDQGMMHGTELKYSWKGTTRNDNDRNFATASFEHGQVHGEGLVTSVVNNGSMIVTAKGWTTYDIITNLSWEVAIQTGFRTWKLNFSECTPKCKVSDFKRTFNITKKEYVQAALAVYEEEKHVAALEEQKRVALKEQKRVALEEQKRVALEAKKKVSRRKKKLPIAVTQTRDVTAHNEL